MCGCEREKSELGGVRFSAQMFATGMQFLARQLHVSAELPKLALVDAAISREVPEMFEQPTGLGSNPRMNRRTGEQQDAHARLSVAVQAWLKE